MVNERSTEVRLNLGCGSDPRSGFWNIDRCGFGADVFMDAQILGFKDQTIHHIEALHLVEHLGYFGTVLALSEWYRVLVPGATLTIETPDFPESARRFAQADLTQRALLANWIFGLETLGMEHRFGFEYSLLRSMLEEAGFGDVRQLTPRCHRQFPSLRVVATRQLDQRFDARSSFLRLISQGRLSYDDHLVKVELCQQIVPKIMSAFVGCDLSPQRFSELLIELTTYDLDIAAAALEALRPFLAPRFDRQWTAALSDPQIAEVQRLLTGALLQRPPRPGQMAISFREVLDQGRAYVLSRLSSDKSINSLSAMDDQCVVVRPFSLAGLAHAAEQRVARALKAFVRNDLETACRDMSRAACFNSDDPRIFWNLSRLALARGDRGEAICQLDQGVAAAERASLSVCHTISREREKLMNGIDVEPKPVSFTLAEAEGNQ